MEIRPEGEALMCGRTDMKQIGAFRNNADKHIKLKHLDYETVGEGYHFASHLLPK